VIVVQPSPGAYPPYGECRCAFGNKSRAAFSRRRALYRVAFLVLTLSGPSLGPTALTGAVRGIHRILLVCASRRCSEINRPKPHRNKLHNFRRKLVASGPCCWRSDDTESQLQAAFSLPILCAHGMVSSVTDHRCRSVHGLPLNQPLIFEVPFRISDVQPADE